MDTLEAPECVAAGHDFAVNREAPTPANPANDESAPRSVRVDAIAGRALDIGFEPAGGSAVERVFGLRWNPFLVEPLLKNGRQTHSHVGSQVLLSGQQRLV